MYTNVDSLTNKLHELKTLLNNTSFKPKVIALTQVKHKSRWSAALSEFNILWHNIYSNNLNFNNSALFCLGMMDVDTCMTWLNLIQN